MRNFLHSLSRSPNRRIGGLCIALLWATAWISLGHHLDAGADKTHQPHSLARVAAVRQSEETNEFGAVSDIQTPAYRTKKIQDIRVGDRVMVELPAQARAAVNEKLEELSDIPSWDNEDVDPATWRRIEMTMPDENRGRFDIVLLRPVRWIEEESVEVGGSVFLSMPEQGLEGPAEVISVGPCPSIIPGSGRVVTGTFTHIRGGIIELRVAGLDKSIGVTENHPIYSLDREEFVHAGDLRLGERLRGLDGPTQVLAIKSIAGEHRVYNFEVHGDHVYHASTLGVLVHNASPGGRGFQDILNDDAFFNRWLKSSHDPARPLSPAEATSVWQKLVNAGRNPRLDPPQGIWPWHINVPGTTVHIPVPPGWIPWPLI